MDRLAVLVQAARDLRVALAPEMLDSPLVAEVAHLKLAQLGLAGPLAMVGME